MKFKVFGLIIMTFIYNLTDSRPTDSQIIEPNCLNNSPDTVIFKMLTELDLDKFIGKTVDELLLNDTIKFYTNYFSSDEPPFKLDHFNLVFANGLYLKIYSYDMKYVERYSLERKWDFNTFKKEKISKLVIDSYSYEQNLEKNIDDK